MDTTTQIEPPREYTITFKTGDRATYRIDQKTIAEIAQDWQHGSLRGVYDVEALDGSYRKLAFRFEDVLYIG